MAHRPLPQCLRLRILRLHVPRAPGATVNLVCQTGGTTLCLAASKAALAASKLSKKACRSIAAVPVIRSSSGHEQLAGLVRSHSSTR